MFASSLELIGTWRASRLPSGRFLPLAALLAYAAWIAGTMPASRAAFMPLLMFSLIAQFRLWDDLIDRSRDRAMHPQRVLAQVRSTTPVVAAVAALGALNVLAVMLTSGTLAASGLVVLIVLLAAWYHRYPHRDLLHTHLLLAKYPCFVLIGAAPITDPTMAMIAAISVYCAMCLYEFLDHDEPLMHARKRVCAAHAGGLAVTPWLLGFGFAAATSSIVSACALYWCADRRSTIVPRALRQTIPFVACALTLGAISLERFT
jgi:hypothetical protein